MPLGLEAKGGGGGAGSAGVNGFEEEDVGGKEDRGVEFSLSELSVDEDFVLGTEMPLTGLVGEFSVTNFALERRRCSLRSRKKGIVPYPGLNRGC